MKKPGPGRVSLCVCVTATNSLQRSQVKIELLREYVQGSISTTESFVDASLSFVGYLCTHSAK